MIRNRFVFSLILLTTVSCIGHRTEYGRKRLIFSGALKSDCSNSKVIDTTKLYTLVATYDLYQKQSSNDFTSSYKFYGDCKVGYFYANNVPSKNSLNPAKAEMGYYYFKEDQLVMKIYVDRAQGGGLSKSIYDIVLRSDTLTLKNNFYTKKFKIVALPDDILALKPDW